jgi:hypothetical protein
MKNIFLLLIGILVNTTSGQILIQHLNDVPDSFKNKYYSQKREYNPLHVGNLWQFSNGSYTFIEKDSLVNGKLYYKKNHFRWDSEPSTFNRVSWERNDTTSGVSFLLDVDDLNNNGDTSDELPIDSLENPWWTRYTTYKYSFGDPIFAAGAKTVLIGDTNWVVLEGDTVISRYFQILGLFWGEEIIEKLGLFSFNIEGPSEFLTGAIINGKEYGTIVNVEKVHDFIPKVLHLFQNYPNPFNPVTTIKFSMPFNNEFIEIIVYDIIGRQITKLLSKHMRAGNCEVMFDASNLASGIYYYTLFVKSQKITKSMVVIK